MTKSQEKFRFIHRKFELLPPDQLVPHPECRLPCEEDDYVALKGDLKEHGTCTGAESPAQSLSN